MPLAFFITARMGSTRLASKHLLEIDGRAVLSHLIERVEAAAQSDDLIVITTGNSAQNHPFNSFRKPPRTRVFFGDDLHIPRRHLAAATALDISSIVAVDGDDPLASVQAMQEVASALRLGAGLVKTTGLPLGMNAWGYSTEELFNAVKASNWRQCDTGWGSIFNDAKADVIPYSFAEASSIRMTLDYPEDLEFFKFIFEQCPATIRRDDQDLLRWILRHDVQHKNMHLVDRYWQNFSAASKASNGICPDVGETLYRTLPMNYSERLNRVIPGGAHTYSRGDDQYPSNAPQILSHGKGAYVWDAEGNKYLDYGMALRSVTIGYAEPEINHAAYEQIEKGNNLTRASIVELEAAELLVGLIDSADMVKFTKNGSTATSAAVKLARAYTGRELIARCAQHPFFSYDDWFIGSTMLTSGIPRNVQEQTKLFEYNNIASLETLASQYPGEIACVILEPAATQCPALVGGAKDCCGKAACTRQYSAENLNFLKEVEIFCRKHGIVFILDEMITGFRWHIKGAQHIYGVSPDLSTFGKAMANGFSVAAVCGKREIMQLGSIDRPGTERLFLLSTTHGAEMCSLGAFIRAVRFIQENDVIKRLWEHGGWLTTTMNLLASQYGLSKYFRAEGPAVNPHYLTLDDSGVPSMELRTLFAQEMIKGGVLMPWLAFSYRHGEAEMKIAESALHGAFGCMRRALDEGIGKYLVGPQIRPVFRKFN